MIDTVLFDFGGVIVAPREDAFYTDTAALLNTTPAYIATVTRPYVSALQRGVFSEADFITRLTNQCGMSADVMNGQISAIYQRHFEPYVMVVEFVQELTRRNITTAVISNTIPSHAVVMRASGLLDMFTTVVLSCEVGMRKPGAEIFQHTLQLLRRNPAQALFVDDIRENIATAQKLGVATVQAQSPEQIIDDIQAALSV